MFVTPKAVQRRQAIPALYRAFAGLMPTFNTHDEEDAMRSLYAQVPYTNFSEQVLVRYPEHLAVLPIQGVAWTNLGHSRRVFAALARRMGRN